ncbi:MAG: VWA domain-containing protein [Polyangiaceae bacterium]|nr:VWA domain-containing protein [Polyangiaceae bacterium]
MKTFLRILGIVLAFAVFVAAGLAYPYYTRWHDLETAIWRQKYFAWGLVVVPFVLLASTLLQDWMRPHLKMGTVFSLARGPRGIRTYLRDLPGAVRAAALVFLIGALCKPITLRTDERAVDTGIDIVIVMDLSGSMRAILDDKPDAVRGDSELDDKKRVTRLDTAKAVVKDFVSRRKSDRIGVVVFAKNAFILSPPTLDYALLNKLVSKLQRGVIDESGTAIGEALGAAVTRLCQPERINKTDPSAPVKCTNETQSKAVILLTDGDNNAGELSPEKATEFAVKHDIKVYTIQIGNDDEVDVEDGTDWLGKPHYTKQRFPVNPELLRQISEKTNGESFIATDGKALESSMHEILDRLEKTRFEAPRSSHEELFFLLLFPGVALVGFEILLRVLLLRRFP